MRDYRQFFMGNKGDIEARYTTNKGRLPEEVIEDMRNAYGRSQTFLQTSKPEVSSEDQIKHELKRQFLIIAGFTEDEVNKMDVDTMSPDEMQGKVKSRLLGAMINNGAKQRVIPLVDVEQFISQGWEYVAHLSDDKAIMKLPV